MGNAEALVDAYGAASDGVREQMVQLSPLVTEALALLNRGGQNPLYGPIPALQTLTNDLATEQQDLAWRLDWIRDTDNLSIDVGGRISADVPADLAAAFRQAGLTDLQVELATDLMRDGLSFTDAVAAAEAGDPLGITPLADRVRELSEAAASGEIGDNDQRIDDAVAALRAQIAKHVPPEDVNAVLVAILGGSTVEQAIAEHTAPELPEVDWNQAVSEQQRLQAATMVVVDGDERQTYIFGIPEDEFWQRMADSGNDLDAVIASIDLDDSLGLLRWEPDSVLMSSQDHEEMLRLREQLGLNENETLFITRDGSKFVRVNPGPNEVFVPVSDWALRRFLGEDPSVTVFGSDDGVRYQPLDGEYWLVSTGNNPPILVPTSAIPDHIVADHYGDSDTAARRQAEFEESLGGTLVAVSDALLEYATSPRGIAELATSLPGIDTFGDVGWCTFDGARWAFTDGNGVDTGLSCASVFIPGVSRAVLNGVSEGGEAAIRATDDIAEAARDVPLGFDDSVEFLAFGDEISEGLFEAGYDDATAIFQGSSVTGESFRTGAPFDEGRVSDFDIALASPEMLDRAEELGIGLRSGGTRTGPLTEDQMSELGILDLADHLSEEAGREVNFMIFATVEEATGRAPSIVVD